MGTLDYNHSNSFELPTKKFPLKNSIKAIFNTKVTRKNKSQKSLLMLWGKQELKKNRTKLNKFML